jgi:hypothetical protein
LEEILAALIDLISGDDDDEEEGIDLEELLAALADLISGDDDDEEGIDLEELLGGLAELIGGLAGSEDGEGSELLAELAELLAGLTEGDESAEDLDVDELIAGLLELLEGDDGDLDLEALLSGLLELLGGGSDADEGSELEGELSDYDECMSTVQGDDLSATLICCSIAPDAPNCVDAAADCEEYHAAGIFDAERELLCSLWCYEVHSPWCDTAPVDNSPVTSFETCSEALPDGDVTGAVLCCSHDRTNEQCKEIEELCQVYGADEDEEGPDADAEALCALWCYRMPGDWCPTDLLSALGGEAGLEGSSSAGGNKSKGLSTAAIVGIAVGGVILVAAIVGGVVYGVRKKRENTEWTRQD